jgi:hypothetical protein
LRKNPAFMWIPRYVNQLVDSKYYQTFFVEKQPGNHPRPALPAGR